MIVLRLIRDGIMTLSPVEDVPFLNVDKREVIQQLWRGEKPESMIRKFEKTLDALEGINKNLSMPIVLSDWLLALRPDG